MLKVCKLHGETAHFPRPDGAFGIKSFALSVKGLSYSGESLVAEAEKCMLVRKNCHTEIEGGLIKLKG